MKNASLHIFFILLCAVLISSCKGEKTSSQQIERIRESLKTWNLDAEVSESISQDEIVFEIYFKGEPEGLQYFHDQESNTLLVNLLMFQNMELEDLFDKVSFSLRFDNVSTTAKFHFDEKGFLMVKRFFENSVFLNNVQLSLKSFGYADVVALDTMIKKYSQEVRKLDFEPRYWTMIEGASKFCGKGQKDHLQEVVVMIMMEGYMFYEDFPLEPAKGQEVFRTMLNYCDVPEDLREENLDEIERFLQEK